MSKPKEYYQELLDEFAASGKSFSEFCIDNGISKNAFYYAKDRMDFESQKKKMNGINRKSRKSLSK